MPVNTAARPEGHPGYSEAVDDLTPVVARESR